MSRCLAAIPPEVKSVLGKEVFTKEYLLAIPKDWRHCKGWGVYLDILTGPSITNLDGYELYVGGSTSKKGLRNRMNDYVRVKRTGNKGTLSGTHIDHVCRSDIEINLRPLALFSRDSVPRPYVYLLEKIMSVFLQTYSGAGRKRAGHAYSTLASLQWTQLCVPPDLPKVHFKGMNSACQLLQGISAPKRRNRVCFQCKKTDDGKKWYYSDSDQPFVDYMCKNCYQVKRRSGNTRTAEQQSKVQVRSDKALTKLDRCESCRRTPQEADKRRRHLTWNLTLNRWLCSICEKSQWYKDHKPAAAIAPPAPPSNPDLQCECHGRFFQVLEYAPNTPPHSIEAYSMSSLY